MMTRGVRALLERVLEREGWKKGVINRAADRGGLTKGGITSRPLSIYLGRLATLADFEALTYEQAIEIYFSQFVVQPGYVLICDPWLQELVVDFGIIAGADDATPALQAALAADGLYTGKVDGVFGPKTAAAVNAADATRIGVRVLMTRSRKHVDVTMNDPAMVAFLKANPKAQAHNYRGWNNRVLELVEARLLGRKAVQA